MTSLPSPEPSSIDAALTVAEDLMNAGHQQLASDLLTIIGYRIRDCERAPFWPKVGLGVPGQQPLRESVTDEVRAQHAATRAAAVPLRARFRVLAALVAAIP